MPTKPTCEVTHRQITRGTCPWCDLEVDGDDPNLPGIEGRSGMCRWNVAAMEAALQDQEVEVRADTVWNLMGKHGPPPEIAARLLGQPLQDDHRLVRELAEDALSRLGREMTAEDAAAFEARAEQTPHELTLRIVLLAYYFPGQQESTAAQAARQRHLLWVIRNFPALSTAGTPLVSVLKKSDPQFYQEAESLWLQQVEHHSDQAKVLGNAAKFFLLSDSARSESLLLQAQALEPQNAEWSRQLGHLYSLQSKRPSDEAPQFAKLALHAFQEADNLPQQAPFPELDEDSPEAREAARIIRLMEKMSGLSNLAMAAIAAGQVEEAERYATELLAFAESDESSEFFHQNGNAMFYGHLALGMCAMHRGDIEPAKQHLLASGQTHGSPNLASFGPNMTLAKQLLERGERDVVLRFFDLCGGFWKSGKDQLQQWTEQVQRGKIPNFGPNLNY